MATIQQLISNKSALYHIGDGYFYRRLKKKGNKLYLTCDNPKCSAIGVTNVNFCEPIVLISVKHNHRPIVNRSLVKVQKSSDLRRCCHQAGSGKTMYDKKYKKFDLKLPGLASVRKLSSLPLVTSMAQYAKLFRKKHFTWLSKTRSGQRFFVKLIEDHTMLFISPATKFLLKELEVTYIISINRTCYFIPKDIQPCMLVTVLGIYENKEIPIVFALMKCCCTSTYEQLLRSIIDEEPGWKPQTIIVDYDDEIRTAIKHVQPTCQLLGNWYHFSKDIRTRLHNMKLVPIINEDKYLDRFVRMCIALPLLPASMVQMGFEYVSKTILCRPKTNKFKSLLNHIKNYWIDDIKAKELSVKYDPRRINNYCEEYIGYLTQLVGIRRSGKVNPTVLTFNGT